MEFEAEEHDEGSGGQGGIIVRSGSQFCPRGISFLTLLRDHP